MHREPHIRLDIPDPEEFDDAHGPYMLVPSAVGDFGIELLQCFVTQWKQNRGSEPVKEIWDALALSTAQMLSALMRAWVARDQHGGAGELVEQIAWFCRWPETAAHLEALRNRPQTTHNPDAPETAHIIDALLALYQESKRRRNERMRQRTPSSQEPAADDERGWDF